MSNNRRAFCVDTAVAFAATLGASYESALAASDPLATTPTYDGSAIHVGPGEDAAKMEEEEKRGISKYEDLNSEGGGGAPQKTLIDNDVAKVILVAYKKGFARPGGLRRRHNTLLVYVDEGRFSNNRAPPGSVTLHRKYSITSPIHIDEDYRVLYVEMKG